MDGGIDNGRDGRNSRDDRDSRERRPMGPREENTVFIGNKPPMNYVMAVVTQFHNGSPEVKLKSRGRAISCAVDVAEIVRNRFLPGTKIGKIEIGTENVTSEKGDKMNISSIEIVLVR
jgi:DNA-binding protein